VENGTLTLRLANGKELTTRRGFELACFLASQGSSIVPLSSKRRGGKSKGARGRGRQMVKRTRDAQ